MLSGKGFCDELITRPEESYRLCCVVVCDLETSRMGAPYIYDISHLRVKNLPPEILKRFFRRYAYALNVREGNSMCIDPEVLVFLLKAL